METSNCLLELSGWVDRQEGSKVYFNEYILELVSEQLESVQRLKCSDCILRDDCKPRPLFKKDEYVGVQVSI